MLHLREGEVVGKKVLGIHHEEAWAIEREREREKGVGGCSGGLISVGME